MHRHRQTCAGGAPSPPCQALRSLKQPGLAGPFLRLQNCQDSAFCTRLRGNTNEAFYILPDSVAVEGARLTATVVNADSANATFRLAFTSYGNTLRLFIDEPAEKGRFRVPDVLLPGLESREQVGRLLPGPCSVFATSFGDLHRHGIHQSVCFCILLCTS